MLRGELLEVPVGEFRKLTNQLSFAVTVGGPLTHNFYILPTKVYGMHFVHVQVYLSEDTESTERNDVGERKANISFEKAAIGGPLQELRKVNRAELYRKCTGIVTYHLATNFFLTGENSRCSDLKSVNGLQSLIVYGKK